MSEPLNEICARWIVPTGQDIRVDLFLSRQTGRSRAFIQYQIDQGNVRCNETIVGKASQKVKSGDQIRTNFNEEFVSELQPIAKKLDVLFEDESVLVINKPQGWVVHPASAHRGETLVHYLLHYFQSHREFNRPESMRPGIVHRLDRGTSGVLLVAKNRSSQEILSKQFKDRLVKKEYESVVWGMLAPEGRFESLIGRHRTDRKRMTSRTPAGREALTLWRTLHATRHFTHVALFPHTGRTHQLRVHLSENRNPIVGDKLYDKKAFGARSARLECAIRTFLEKEVTFPFLHARKLHFLHPVRGTPLEIVAPRPQLFDEFLRLIENGDR